MQAKYRLIVALDVDTEEQVRKLVFDLNKWVGFFKIGVRLFFHYGPSVVELVNKFGGRVFLDAKLHDIPSVVEAAAGIIGKMGVSMLTVHTLGGIEMMKRSVQAAKRENSKIKVLGVTLLTSLDEKILKEELGIEGKMKEKVLFLAQKAKEAGLDGVVCSGKEVGVLRKSLGQDFLLVVPGIRMGRMGRIKGDEQKRVLTPQEAVRRGADYLVIGRPILQSPDPVKTAKKMGSGLAI